MAFISDAANLAQLEQHKDMSRRLAVARGIDEEQARAMAREIKPIVHIDGGLHATEVAERAAHHPTRLRPGGRAKSRSSRRSAQNLIVELWFSINPDGQNIVANWYRENVGHALRGQPAAGAVPGVRRARQQSRRVHAEHGGIARDHQGDARHAAADLLHAAPVGAVPRAHLPAAVRGPDLGQHASADAAVAQPDRHDHRDRTWTITGCRGRCTRRRSTSGIRGIIDNIGNFRHTISFFTETALYRYATPHFYTVDEFPVVAADARARRCSIRARGRAAGGAWRMLRVHVRRRYGGARPGRRSIASRCSTTSTARRATPSRSSRKSRRSPTRSRASNTMRPRRRCCWSN